MTRPKLDGARVQVHRAGDRVAVFTRSLRDITTDVPAIVAGVRALPVESVILDGEAVSLGTDGRPESFQVTMQRLGDEAGGEGREATVARFFDCLHRDGVDLIDQPLRERLAALDDVVPADQLVQRHAVTTIDGATAFFDQAVTDGFEGVVVKALDAPYEAGRRGAAWRKVKPSWTLDLVVLAVEWGSGRRRGWLSNLHLGARASDGGFVMLGKTFKGMTDEMLAWQTQRFLELETHRTGHVVHVDPYRSSRSPSTASRPAGATPAVWHCGSPGSSGTATTRPPTPRTPSTRSGPSATAPDLPAVAPNACD
ncbi:hypothetical protein BH23ACT10_BH23ACT10_01650 [soil metagenome]